MESILKPLKDDLKSLYENDVIISARQLNDNLKRKFIAEKHRPMYFTGKFDAKTVFIMLNPGGASDDCYSFNQLEKYKYADFNDFYEKYKFEHINYGTLDSCRMDNFDLKQAAFLYDFIDSGISIPDFFNESKSKKTLKLKAKENVLTNKLQLELIPYCSVEFNGVLDNEKQAMNNIDILLPHVNRLLDAIVSFERKYVIFGAKQFANLFRAYEDKGYGKIEFGKVKCDRIDEMKNRVFWRTVKIKHKDRCINALIPYSFPRRDLPNAYEKMRKYGKLCFLEFINTFNKR